MIRMILIVNLGLTERQEYLLSLVILLMAQGVYFGNPLGWTPLRLLYWCVLMTLGPRVVARRRVGAFMILFGFCVGEFINLLHGCVLV